MKMTKLKVCLTLLLSLVNAVYFAANHFVQFSENVENLSVFRHTREGLLLNLQVNNLFITEESTTLGEFTVIQADSFIGTKDVGRPELLYLSRMITVPLKAEVEINYLHQRTQKVDLAEFGYVGQIRPAQGSQKKTNQTIKTPLTYIHLDKEAYLDSNYQIDFSPVSIREMGFLRGHRIFEIIYTPVQYNPVENSLLIYEQLEMEINFFGADWVATDFNRNRTWSADFEKFYQYFFLNYESPQNRNALERMPTKYVIICYPDFMDAIQPFVEWKTRQGFYMIVESTANPAVGNSNSSIKNYLQSLYDAATPDDPAPSYLLFVGDVEQIPPWPTLLTGEFTGHITDSGYVRLEGNDYLPEMYSGRFSAKLLEQVIAQVDKNLMYQQHIMPEPDYLGKAQLIVGYDAYWGPRIGNGGINYLTQNYVNTTNPYHNYTEIYTTLYPTSDPNVDSVRSYMADGSGFVTYSGHGDWFEWQGQFSSLYTATHISQMHNYGKYPIIIANACFTNQFDQNESLAESFVRPAGKGAIAYIGGSNFTYWEEDYWWAVGFQTVRPPETGEPPEYDPNQLGMYDMLFHTHSEATEDWHVSTGALTWAGNMVVQNGNSPAMMKAYYWEIYHIMGDPSLVPYLGLPQQNIGQYPSQLLLGVNELHITGSAPFARVGFSMLGNLISTAFTDELGNATLTFSPLETAGFADLVITAQNYQPIIDRVVLVPTDRPMLIISQAINPETGDETVKFNTESELLITIRNVGFFAANNIDFTLWTESEEATIISGQQNVVSIPAESNFSFSEPFRIKVSEHVENSSLIEFVLRAETAPEQVWEMPFALQVKASFITNTLLNINDSAFNQNGRLDPGEEVQINTKMFNTGKVASLPGTIMVVSTNPEVFLETSEYIIPEIETDQYYILAVNVHVGEEIPLGSITNLSFFSEFSNQQNQDYFTLPIGLVMEDFSTGDFSGREWIHGVNPWQIVSDETWEGEYAARSGEITHNQASILETSHLVERAGVLRFHYKLSTEPTNDRLQFYLNNNLLGEWSGEVNWTEVRLNIPVGNHNFRWLYRKNDSVSNGLDAVWLDNIIFPTPGEEVFTPMIAVNKEHLDFGELGADEVSRQTFTLINLGNQTLTGSFSLPEGVTINHTPNFSIDPFQNMMLEVSLTVNTAGIIEKNLLINHNDTNNEVINILITAYGTTSDFDSPEILSHTKLSHNYPNPFNPTTTITFTLAGKTASHVRLEIFNIKGQKVRTLVNHDLNPGKHQLVFNGRDDQGHIVATGLYFYRLQTNNYQAVRKMILLK